MNKDLVSRAQGCLLGQLTGDALGSLVEFKAPDEIKRLYPNGLRKISDGGTWNTIAGQPTDDSEMALVIARMLVEKGHYDVREAKKAYIFWLNSNPFDCGITVSSSLRGNADSESQGNGAMMRISPLGIFGAKYPLNLVAEWARQDAAITHPNPICQQANALYAMAIAYAIKHGCTAEELYQLIIEWAGEMHVDENLSIMIQAASKSPPVDYIYRKGWVLIAFHNALWQILHAPNLEEAIVDTVMRGGDTDTNAAICGVLMGAIYGIESIPKQWVESVLTCRPEEGKSGVNHPRPECFWPVDALELAEKLIYSGLENHR